MRHVVHAASDLGTEGWRKPWSGSNNGNCVEAKTLDGERVALRQSRDPNGPALIYPAFALAEFIKAAKSGEADFLLA
ncbi:DUF397 domain-containing protein [Streptomyces tauricus]